MIQDYFVLATRNLRKKKLRTGLTLIGIIISIATIFVLISLAIGLDNAVKEQFRQMGTDKFFVMARGQNGVSTSGTDAITLTVKDADIIEKVSGVKEVVYFNLANSKIEYRDQARYYMIIGMPEDNRKLKLIFEAMNVKVDEGRLIKNGDSKKVIMGYSYKYANLYNRPV